MIEHKASTEAPPHINHYQEQRGGGMNTEGGKVVRYTQSMYIINQPTRSNVASRATGRKDAQDRNKMAQ